MSGVKRGAEDAPASQQTSQGQSQQEVQDSHAEKAQEPNIKRVRLDEGLGQPSSPLSDGIDATPSSPTNSLLKSKNKRNNSGNRSGRGARGGGRGGRGGDKKNNKGKQRDWNDSAKSNRNSEAAQKQEGDDAERDEDAGPRIPKKKVAMLIGYSGLGYSGSQV